jgi:hypothetical protein
MCHHQKHPALPSSRKSFDRYVPRGVKGHNMNDNTLPGSPFDILRAVSSVQRPQPMYGELHFLEKGIYYYTENPNLSIKIIMVDN